MTPTPEQIAKLPKWAQERMENLERCIERATTALHECLDEQTPSAFYITDLICINPNGPPKTIQRNIQTHKITCESNGVGLDVRITNDGCINVSWSGKRRMRREVGMIPTGYQQIELRPNPLGDE